MGSFISSFSLIVSMLLLFPSAFALLKARSNQPARQVFNIMKYGAVADGKRDCSQAVISAWKEACAVEGKATVLIPKGSFLVGPVVLEGPCKARPIVFQVKGFVKAPGLEKFNSDSWFSFERIDGLSVNGGGTFDGQGALAWPHNKCTRAKDCKVLPTSLKFIFVSNASIRDISSKDSKFFHVITYRAQNIRFRSLRISAPDESPNTDGIHIMLSDRVKISQSVIGTGDDCISIGPETTNVTISNVFCGPGHGISVGSLGKTSSEKDVRNLIVRNCTFTKTTNGLRIKTWASPVATLSVSNISFEDIIMREVLNPIIIDQQYCPSGKCDLKNPSMVKISDVSYRNIRGTSSSKVAVTLECSKAAPCRNITLGNIDLKHTGPGASVSTCANVNAASFGKQIPPLCV